MPQISRKGNELPQSAIRKLVPFSDAAKERGIHVYHLNIGQPDIETPKGALKRLAETEIGVLAYSHSAGNMSYRKKLCEYYERHDIHVTPDQIIVTTGGSEALQFAFTVCLNPGDEILIPEPYYTNYNTFAKLCDATIKTIPSDIRSGFALPPIEAFEKAITPKTRAIMICNPNNPTGYLYTKQEMRQIRDLVKKYNLYLFSDEVYREFIYTKAPYISACHLEGIEDNVILIDSVSKRYSACGARIGALISKNEELMSAVLKLAQGTLCVPTLEQVGAAALYRMPKSYYDEMKAEYCARRDAAYEELSQIPGIVCQKPAGAFYMTAKLPVDNIEDFLMFMLKEFDENGETAMFAPAPGFYATPGLGGNEMRIAYVLSPAKMRRACELIKKAVAAYNAK